MVILDAEQTRQVATFLQQYRKLTSTQRAELLDHLCCDIESTMEEGRSFEEAFTRCRERWNESEVKNIHSSTQKRFTMVKLIGILLIGMSTITFFSPSLGTNAEELPEKTRFNPVINELAVPLEPPSFCPLTTNYELTSDYGNRIHPISKKEVLHRGVDWKAPLGTPVLAAGNGIILEAGMKEKYGNCIVILHDEIYQTLYAHLESIDVAVGEQIVAGQQIGAVGNSGLSLGTHLHYEVIKNGVPVNPADYLP
jgi:murein DD-endopeptidase MepM/ murein hydrolase activator NlpD